MAYELLERECCVRGYHVYRRIWEAADGEMLDCGRDLHNDHDRYAVSVLKDGATVGHLPRKISKLCSLFLRRGGSIQCVVTGRRRYSADLPQGGLEVPCKLLFKASTKEIQKLKRLYT